MTDHRKKPEILASVLTLVSLNYRNLRAALDHIHASIELTPGMRGTLILLAEGPNNTMSQIAARRRVSRQLIHRLVSQLMEMGLVQQRPNPRHKTSPLICLTELGEREVRSIQSREAEPLFELSADLDREEMLVVETFLSKLADKLVLDEDQEIPGSLVFREPNDDKKAS